MRRVVLGVLIALPLWAWGLLVVSNQYIAIYHDENTSAYYLKTVQGDPDNPFDDDAYLLYNKFPPTTISTIRVNNENIIFGSDTGYYEKRPYVLSNMLISVWSVRGVSIEQTIALAPNPVNGISNNVRISYRLKNTTKRNVSVGLRLLLDVYLRESGVSSFDIPGRGRITKETLFYQDSIPDYWYTASSDGKIRVRGSLKGLEFTPPSQVIFASWNKLYDNLWDVPLDTSQALKRSSQYSGAVALYYNPVSLAPDQSLLITTMYGIHTEQSFTSNDMTLSIILPEEVKAPPVPVSAELVYTGKVPLDSLSLILTPPKGFTLAEEDTNVVTFLKVQPNESKKIVWNLQRVGSVAGKYPVRVSAIAVAQSTSNSITGTKEFFINYREVESLIIKTNIPLPAEVTNTVSLETNLPMTVVQPSSNAVVITNTVVITNAASVTNFVITTYPPNIQEKIREITTISDLIESLNREYALWVAIYRNSEVISDETFEELQRRVKWYEEQVRLLQMNSQTNK